MSNRFVKVMVPPPVEAPRGARWLAWLAVAILRALTPQRSGDSVAVARITRERASRAAAAGLAPRVTS
jgi:hypothetical protein